MPIYQIYKENSFSGEAKYLQLANAIKKAIEKGLLKKTDRLPSIAGFRENLGLGKETILKAIELLKAEGMITAVHGKGFFVKRTDVNNGYRLFVLFDEFSEYKKDLYHSIHEELPQGGGMQVFFHHYNPQLFYKLITDHLGDFTHYLIMPFLNDQVRAAIKTVPDDKLYLLDRNEILPPGIPAVFQDYQQDVFSGFLKIRDQLKSYQKIFLVFPSCLNHPISIVSGFEKICREIGMAYEIVERVDPAKVKKRQAWFVIEDNDLVQVIEKVQDKGWETGKDLGVISYNDTAMKRIAAGGITTLSTDFTKMGKTIIMMILSGKDKQVRSYGTVIERGSL